MTPNDPISRANFLRNSLAWLWEHSAIGKQEALLWSTANAQVKKADEILVVIFQRGGCDGMNFVAPISGADRKTYESERPNLKMPIDGPAQLLKLDERFGIHPSAKEMHALFQAKKLAIVHGAGLEVNTRSHFDAQNFIEYGVQEKRNASKGWISRFLDAHLQVDPQAAIIPSISVSPIIPAALENFSGAVTVSDLGRLTLGFNKNLDADQQHLLETIYSYGSTQMHHAGSAAIKAMNLLQSGTAKKDSKIAVPEYPKADIGNRMRLLAQLLKLDLGARVATIDMGGWDTHKDQGAGTNGGFAALIGQLSQSISVFFQDLQAANPGLKKRVTILVMTEFGRRLRENANRGTDHGHGGVYFIAGDSVKGGKVYGQWPGLETERLYERADLAVTTDYRQIIAEILQSRYQFKAIASVFPEYKIPSPLNFMS